MDQSEEQIAAALAQTRVVRPPRQRLATFGTSKLHYFLVTRPVYEEISGEKSETVIREGWVIAKRPDVVTPSYMLRVFGFGDEARASLEMLANTLGPNAPGLMYSYTNEADGLEIVSGGPDSVADRIKSDLDGKGEGLAVVLRGDDVLWDVSLMKFIYEYTASSLAGNVSDLMGRGLLDPDPSAGVPRAAIEGIEELFRSVERGQADPSVVKQELDRWDLFDRYQDRFLALFRKRLY